MKPRPPGFLAKYYDHPDTEVGDYIVELHRYLWRFVRTIFPEASGDLSRYLDNAIGLVEHAWWPAVARHLRRDSTVLDVTLKVYKTEEGGSYHPDKVFTYLRGKTEDGSEIEVTIKSKNRPPIVGTEFQANISDGVEP